MLVLALKVTGWLCVAAALVEIVRTAYRIRLFAIQIYGPVIHEFDPWFNYRATEYLAQHGWKKFFTWFDHMSWYPLGRPVGTTIYPGMQIASVAIWRALAAAGTPWSVNKVCCYVPAWFGGAASIFVGLLAHEASFAVSGGSGAALVAGCAIMAVVPAHTTKSMGGGFDNESVAITPMCAALFFWARSLRTPRSWWIAALAGISYGCMAASWGGYVFLLNVIGAHAALLVLLGYDHSKVHRAYSLFFLTGTWFATSVPAVGWAPFKSLEQLGPLLVFLFVQLVCLWKAPRWRPVFHFVIAVLVAAVPALYWSGYFAPLSGRVRALFIKSATKTGNPLVDSVSEHRPRSPDAYWSYLHYAGSVALVGPLAFLDFEAWPSEASLLVLVLGASSQFFSLKMARLMCLMGPAVSVLAGCALGAAFDHAVSPIWRSIQGPSNLEKRYAALRIFNTWPARLLRLGVAAAAVWASQQYALDFYKHSFDKARYAFSNPRIITRDKKGNINDEIRQAYGWLRDNTAPDARVLAWWDYGYQLAGVANRTTLADGNTWNMEHIGLIGMVISAPLPEGHRIARHLADYVLFFREDVGKSSHMARIANSAFPGHCEEITCDQFGVFRNGVPAPMMRDSLVWYINRPGTGYDTTIGDRLYKVVHESAHGRIRIAQVKKVSKKSKAWSANPQNRKCDAPGSWYCPGEYPPLLRQLLGWDEIEEGNHEAELHRVEYDRRVRQQQKAAPGPHGPGIPEGSYLDSCQGCRLEEGGKLLVCARCTLPGKASSESRLRLRQCTTGLVDNIHGQLTCVPEQNADDIPPGPYADTCLGCKLQDLGRRLTCSSCTTKNGRRRATSISLLACAPPLEVVNSDGQLVCPGLGNAPDIPPGPYQDKCQGCGLENGGTRLRCAVCVSPLENAEVTFELAQCPRPGKLEHNHGELVCIDMPHGPGVPEGGYLKSCHGCRVESGTLSCTGCRGADGRWRASSELPLSRCAPPGRVDNSDGSLICD